MVEFNPENHRVLTCHTLSGESLPDLQRDLSFKAPTAAPPIWNTGPGASAKVVLLTCDARDVTPKNVAASDSAEFGERGHPVRDHAHIVHGNAFRLGCPPPQVNASPRLVISCTRNPSDRRLRRNRLARDDMKRLIFLDFDGVLHPVATKPGAYFGVNWTRSSAAPGRVERFHVDTASARWTPCPRGVVSAKLDESRPGTKPSHASSAMSLTEE